MVDKMIYLLIPIALVLVLIARVMTLFDSRIPQRNHYDGNFGDQGTGEKLSDYDKMTAAEHDEAGALWAQMARGDDE
jgi:hypothetical protein